MLLVYVMYLNGLFLDVLNRILTLICKLTVIRFSFSNNDVPPFVYSYISICICDPFCNADWDFVAGL